jgi:hypothetical protein
MDRIEERRSRFEPPTEPEPEPALEVLEEDKNEKSENFQTNLDFGFDL